MNKITKGPAPKKPKATIKKVNYTMDSLSMFTPFDPDYHLEEFLSEALRLAPQMQLFHLNTRSYAEHMALDEFYKEWPLLVDRLAETHIAKTNKDLEFKPHTYHNSAMEVLEYICSTVQSLYSDCRATNNILDDMSEFAKAIKYKISRLK